MTDSQFDRATALRQPGSAFKPFVYHRRARARAQADRPLGRRTRHRRQLERPAITKANTKAKSRWRTRWPHSSNSVAVQLTNEVGPAAVVHVARRLGITSDLMAVPSLALGTSEVTPLELTGAYATFANGGEAALRLMRSSVYAPPRAKCFISAQGSGTGRVMMPTDGRRNRPRMMHQTVIDGHRAGRALEGRPSAGKTGTSQDYRDAWFVGFTPDLVCGVWIGNDEQPADAPRHRRRPAGAHLSSLHDRGA